MENKVFVGLGKNPDPGGLDMPMGLGMELYQNKNALHFFAALSQDERNRIIRYVDASTDGKDTKRRIDNAIENLNRRNVDF